MKGKLKIQFSKKSIIFIAMLAVIIAVDLITKYYAKLYDWQFTIIKGVLVINYTQNTGMAFSFMEGKSAFLIAFSSVMILVIIGFILFVPERFTLLKLALYMILAGAIGNLVDRIAYGFVRDFIWMVIPGATCNVADIFIVVGTFIAVIDLLFLNEWAVFPLTKKAKAVQEAKRREEEAKKNQAEQAEQPTTEQTAEPTYTEAQTEDTLPGQQDGEKDD